MNAFYLDVQLKSQNSSPDPAITTDEDVRIINSLRRNAPLKKLNSDQINTRSIIIMGEEPTSKLSIHPQRLINNKQINTLADIAKKLPGAPMLVGHRQDKTPWGRTFKAQVIDKTPGYSGAVVKEAYFFLNDDEGNAIARKIDAGIWAEGSISYWFQEARCSICHTPMASMSFLGINAKIARCNHILGKKDQDTGQICYWYPYNIVKIGETSYVFAGAYSKTRSFLDTNNADYLNELYSPDQITAATELESQLLDAGLDIKNIPPQIDVTPSLDTIHSNTPPPSLTLVVSTPTKGPINDTPTQNTQQPPSPDSTPNPPITHQQTLTTEKTKNNPPIEGEATDPPITSNDSSDDTLQQHTTLPDPNSNATTLSPPSPGEQLDRGAGKGKGGKPQGDGGASKCVCPKCGYETPHIKGTPCTESKCPKCHTTLQGKNMDNIQPTTQPNSQIPPPIPTNNSPKTTLTATNLDNLPSNNHTDQTATNPPKPTIPIEKNSANHHIIEKNSISLNPNKPTIDNVEDPLSAALAFMDRVSDSLTPEDLSDLTSIFNTPDFDIDERETFLRTALKSASVEILNEALDLLDRISDSSLSPPLLIFQCVECSTHFDVRPDAFCPHCGAQVIPLEDYRVVLFNPVGPIKPTKSGICNNEFFKKEDLVNLPTAVYFVEPKYDGVWMELHRLGDKVRFYTAEGNEYSEKFPALMAEALKIKATSYIIAGELTRWHNRRRLGHTDVAAYLHTKAETYDDKDFKYKPFDLMLLLGRAVTDQPLDARRRKLDSTFKWGKQIHPTAHRVVKHVYADSAILSTINDRATREGVMIKDIHSLYSRRDQKSLYKWKQQSELDVRVKSVMVNTGGGYIYTCEVGRGTNVQVIGATYTTTIKALIGNILQVSVDHVRYDKPKNNYSWFAPKVVALRADKKLPDPLSALRALALVKGSEPKSRHIITLTEVLPRLKRAALDLELYLIGSLVEEGLTTHDIDILSRVPLGENDVRALTDALGMDLAFYLDITIDQDGPAGPSIPLITDMKNNDAMWKYSNMFVLQEHGWGKKVHYDLRFGAPRTKRMWGWTCFSKPSFTDGGAKTRCQEKKYHDPKWMDFDKKTIPPGQPGNPTKNLNAWITKIDTGTYEYICRKPNFLELVFHGTLMDGRYLWRHIEVKHQSQKTIDAHHIPGDEVDTKTDKIWVMWKPKDQEPGKAIHKLAYKFIDDCFMFWETDEVDTILEHLENIVFDSTT